MRNYESLFKHFHLKLENLELNHIKAISPILIIIN